MLPWFMGFATIAYGALSRARPRLPRPRLAGLSMRDGKEADKAAMALFSFSILYLFLLFAEIIGDARS